MQQKFWMFPPDNTQLSLETNRLICMGRRIFNNGITVQEKDEGISLILQGIKKLDLLIRRQQNKTSLSCLKEQYNDLYKEIEDKLITVENLQKQEKKAYEIYFSNDDGSDYQSTYGSSVYSVKDNPNLLKSILEQCINTEKPNLKLAEIAGHINAKETLKESIILPIRFPDLFQDLRKPSKGILLYGPSGTGKTFLAKACATETGAELIRHLFALAREKEPSIVFIDEMDSLFVNYSDSKEQNEASRRIITELLIQMEDIEKNDKGVFVIGATNIPWVIDPAVRRRFKKRIYIPLPDAPTRQLLLQNNMIKRPNLVQDSDFSELAEKTDGFSVADMVMLVQNAVYEQVKKLQSAKKFKFNKANGKYMPVEDSAQGPDIQILNYMDLKQNQLELPLISRADFNEPLRIMKQSIVQVQLKQYENWTKEFGQEG